VLLHATSLPDATLVTALRFVDWLAAAGCTLWQVLPVGPVGADGSPYAALSAFAGNTHLLADATQPEPSAAALETFRAAHADWLPDYALYRALRAAHGGSPWTQWPAPLRDREPRALADARDGHAAAIVAQEVAQWRFAQAWQRLRDHAAARGVLLFGDLPFFVAHDSADAWAHREAFLLDAAGHPRIVAGVPPDYFSATGQRWGNPVYDWQRSAADGHGWWRRRVTATLRRFDVVRLDHFRAFAACWQIPASEPTAVHGEWVASPGAELLDAFVADNGAGRLVAEDLGIVTDEVHALRARHALPGMRVLQFAFGGGADNPHVPHRHVADAVVYTGTHDNDTTLGWYAGLAATERQRVDAYLGYPAEPMPWPLLRTALASVAQTAVLPLQDLLALGSAQRMNTPGTVTGNWHYRCAWPDLDDALAQRLRGMLALYERL
jgi:4-alpha-glucanotransferase